MPEPLLYLKAMAAAAATCAFAAHAFRLLKPEAYRTACAPLVLAIGAAVGLWVVGIIPHWPPASALDRLLIILLPAVVLIETAAQLPRVPPWLYWSLRSAVAFAAARVLLHRSSYLTSPEAWSRSETIATLLICAALLGGTWWLLVRLSSRRDSDTSLAMVLALALSSAGATIMLAGYLSGGAVALLFSAALFGGSLGIHGSKAALDGLVSLGTVALFGLCFIGRYFGSLSTNCALTLFLSPLLCWATELHFIRNRPHWQAVLLRLIVVGTPLAIVLWLAKRHFDQHTAPLL